MTNKKVTRRALLMSVTSLLICISMLLGTTFAWFTDEVTSGVNQIVAGNLDVELYHKNAMITSDNVKVDSDTNLFQNALGNSVLWEPGAVAYETFKVVNKGSLSFDYKLNFIQFDNNYVVPAGADTASDKSLLDVIRVHIDGTGATPTDRPAFSEADPTLGAFKAAGAQAFTGTLAAGTDSSKSFTIILYWPSDTETPATGYPVDNDYDLKNGAKASDAGTEVGQLWVKFGVQLLATQHGHATGDDIAEKDSFGPDYDVNATYPVGAPLSINEKANKAITPVPVSAGTGTGFEATVPATTLESTAATSNVPATSFEIGNKIADGSTNGTAYAAPETGKTDSVTDLSRDIKTTDVSEGSMTIDISFQATITTTQDDAVVGTANYEVHKFNNVVSNVIYVGKDLTNVKVKHGSNYLNEVDGTTYIEGDDGVFKYVPTTGYLTIWSSTYSAYTLEYDVPEYVAAIGSEGYMSLVDAIKAANKTGNVTITVLADIDFSKAPYDVYKWAGSTYNPLEITANNVTLDLGGHTISEMGNAALAFGHLLAAHGRISNCTIKNGTLSAGKTDNVTNSYVLGIAGVDGMTIKNVTTLGGINIYTGSKNVVIDSCDVRGTKYYTVCVQSGSDAVIKGTTYTKNTDSTVANKSMFWVAKEGKDEDCITTENTTGAFGASSITIESGTFTVDTTNGGAFYLSSGLKPVVKGGTYNIDPTAYVPEGYMVNEENNLFTVISEADKAVELAKAAGATDVVKSGSTGAIGTMSDNVIYYWDSEGTVYVYDATNYNGYYGEENSDETTYYVNRLVSVNGIAGGAFNDNTNITKLVITKDLDSTSKALNGNTTIKTVEFAEGTTRTNNRLIYNSCVSTVILPSTMKIIEDFSFYAGRYLTSIDVPASVTVIGEKAFDSCTALETVKIRGNAAIGNYAFRNDAAIPSALTNVYLYGNDITFNGTSGLTFSRTSHGNSVVNSTKINVYVVNETVKQRVENATSSNSNNISIIVGEIVG